MTSELIGHLLVHIAPKDRWEASAGLYVDPSLEADGFIHCSTPEQLLIPANERFAGRTDLVLLVIEPALVEAEIVFEDCYESGMAFPHIYGPLPLVAVTAVLEFWPGPDGTFALPPELAELAKPQ